MMREEGEGEGGNRPSTMKQGSGSGYSTGTGEGTGCGLGNYRGDGTGDGYMIHQRGATLDNYRCVRLMASEMGMGFYVCQLHTLGGWR